MATILIIVLLWVLTLVYVKTKVIPAAVDDTFKKLAIPYFQQLLHEHRNAIDAKFQFRDEQMAKCFQEVSRQGQELDDLYAADGRPQAPQAIVTQPAANGKGKPVINRAPDIIGDDNSPKA